MSRKFCRSCGERKRLTWPKDNPECCTQWCAASAFLSYANVVPAEFAICGYCGEPEDVCAERGCTEEGEP